MPEVTPLPLSALTTLRTGAEPRRMVEARTRDELVAAFRDVWESGDDWFALGGGSNLFVGDEPFEGTVVRILTSGIRELPSPRPGVVRWRVEAGHGWDELVAASVAAGLGGISAMSGIPGTVGAAPIQNIGAYGQEIVQTLVEVELLDEGDTDVTIVSAADLALGFRTSALKHHYGSVPERRAVIVSVTLDLDDVGHDPRPVTGAQLRSALGLAESASLSLGDLRHLVLRTRASKGMVLDPADPDTASAGSFFQNPVISAEAARALPAECPRWPIQPDDGGRALRVIPLESYTGLSPLPPAVPAPVKVSAAWLIEQSGVRRGFALPRSRAGVSSKHALALTNRGGATAAELAELARYIRQRVASEFGLVLEPEPVLVGVDL